MMFSRVVQSIVASGAVLALATTASFADTVKLQEGTEIRVRFEERLSSASNVTGDPVTFSLADAITLPGGIVVAPGYRGRGEVTNAKKRGFMGQAGDLSVRLNTLRIGDSQVRLRGSRTNTGQGAMGSTIALTVLFGPLGLLKRGHDITIERGQTISAFVDADVELSTPLTPPPQD